MHSAVLRGYSTDPDSASLPHNRRDTESIPSVCLCHDWYTGLPLAVHMYVSVSTPHSILSVSDIHQIYGNRFPPMHFLPFPMYNSPVSPRRYHVSHWLLVSDRCPHHPWTAHTADSVPLRFSNGIQSDPSSAWTWRLRHGSRSQYCNMRNARNPAAF